MLAYLVVFVHQRCSLVKYRGSSPSTLVSISSETTFPSSAVLSFIFVPFFKRSRSVHHVQSKLVHNIPREFRDSSDLSQAQFLREYKLVVVGGGGMSLVSRSLQSKSHSLFSCAA